jgi:hypothetical protein
MFKKPGMRIECPRVWAMLRRLGALGMTKQFKKGV